MKLERFFRTIITYFRRNDMVMFLTTIAATAIGYILVYSATYTLNSNRLMLVQTIAIVCGIACMVFLSILDYHQIAHLWKYIAVASILLLVITLIIGKGRDGVPERAWIKFGSYFSVQPSEFVKFAFIITFAKHIDLVKNEINKPVNILLLLFHAAVPIGLIFKQGDFGMVLVYTIIFVAMLFAGNVKLRYFVGCGILLLITAPLLWMKLGTRQTGRILALFDPNNYPTQAYQQMQSVSAIGAGETWGYGLLHGPRTQSSYLPEKQNDLIFAVTGEELGFVGCMLVIIVLFILLVRILMTAKKSKDLLGSLICVGIFSCFAIQMVANIGMCLFLMPVIGLTLPFMSYGGTSIVSSFIAIGLALSVGKKESTMLFT